MNRDEVVKGILAQQRNHALDIGTEAAADLAMVREELAAAKTMIVEMEKKIASIVPNHEVSDEPPNAGAA